MHFATSFRLQVLPHSSSAPRASAEAPTLLKALGPRVRQSPLCGRNARIAPLRSPTPRFSKDVCKSRVHSTSNRKAKRPTPFCFAPSRLKPRTWKRRAHARVNRRAQGEEESAASFAQPPTLLEAHWKRAGRPVVAHKQEDNRVHRQFAVVSLCGVKGETSPYKVDLHRGFLS